MSVGELNVLEEVVNLSSDDYAKKSLSTTYTDSH